MSGIGIVLVVLPVVFYVFRRWYSVPINSSTPNRVFPPGPSGIPLIGNILSFNPRGGWTKITEYKRKLGNLIFFHGFGNTILVLNSMTAMNDFFDKRPHIYSNRPLFTVLCELMGLSRSLSFLPYGKEWREHRKLAHFTLSPAATKKYYGLQEDLSALLNKLLLDDPEHFFSHIRLTAGRIVLSVTYGLSVSDVDNDYIAHAEATMTVLGKASVPGAYLCDFIPILKHLPSWMPFHQEAKRGKDMVQKLLTLPFEHVKRSMALGVARPSLTRDLLLQDKGDDQAVFEDRVKWTAGAMFAAGGESTYATILTLVMALALNPAKQRIAQAEIDRVVGTNRQPSMADRPNLPYIEAVIKEVLRWHPALPLGFARLSSEDDFYDGYFIPKGTAVLPNVWAVAREPNEKYNPEEFIPERFIDPECNTVDPKTWAFGFGRRICPGKVLAESSLFVVIAGIIAAFDIHPPSDGKLEPKFGLNLVSYPEPFKCRIEARSLQLAELVRETAVRAAAQTYGVVQTVSDHN